MVKYRDQDNLWETELIWTYVSKELESTAAEIGSLRAPMLNHKPKAERRKTRNHSQLLLQLRIFSSKDSPPKPTK